MVDLESLANKFAERYPDRVEFPDCLDMVTTFKAYLSIDYNIQSFVYRGDALLYSNVDPIHYVNVVMSRRGYAKIFDFTQKKIYLGETRANHQSVVNFLASKYNNEYSWVQTDR